MNRAIAILLMLASAAGLLSAASRAGAQVTQQTADKRLDLLLPTGSNTNPVEIQADQISLDPRRGRLEATGELTIRVDPLNIRASALVLNLKTGSMTLNDPLVLGWGDLIIQGDRIYLNRSTGKMTIEEPKILATTPGETVSALVTGQRAECESDRCVLFESRGTACNHLPVGYEIRAKKTTVHPSGDIDLSRPVLYLEQTPVMALPWLRIRPPRTAGFLPPRLGWDRRAGLILGPAGYVPLGPVGSIQGHMAARTAQGLDALMHLTTSHLDVKIDHLLDNRQNYARLRARVMLPLEGASLVIESDIANSRLIIDDLARDPLERALTHTTSRTLWSADLYGMVLETSFELIHAFDSTDKLSARFLSPAAAITLTYPSTPLADLLWPNMIVNITRFDALDAGLAQDALSLLTPPHTRAQGSFGLDLPAHLGPFDVEARVVSHHQIWLPDGVGTQSESTHLVASEALLALPLARKFDSVAHTISPTVRYRITPWLKGNSPGWVIDDFDRLARGHGFELGLVSKLRHLPKGILVSFEIFERIYLHGFDQKTGPAYLWGSIGLGPSRFRLYLDSAVDHEQALPSTAGLLMATSAEQGSTVEIGARWIGPGRGPHRDPTWHSANGPFLMNPWPTEPGEAVEIVEKTSLRLTQKITILAGARVGAWPRISLHALWYGLEMGSACGCVAAGLLASHRPQSPVPDVMATFAITSH